MLTSSAHTSTTNLIISKTFNDYKNVIVFNNSSVFRACSLGINLPEDDLKNIEAYRSINELYMKVYF